jgi:hypothetical protein
MPNKTEEGSRKDLRPISSLSNRDTNSKQHQSQDEKKKLIEADGGSKSKRTRPTGFIRVKKPAKSNVGTKEKNQPGAAEAAEKRQEMIQEEEARKLEHRERRRAVKRAEEELIRAMEERKALKEEKRMAQEEEARIAQEEEPKRHRHERRSQRHQVDKEMRRLERGHFLRCEEESEFFEKEKTGRVRSNQSSTTKGEGASGDSKRSSLLGGLFVRK